MSGITEYPWHILFKDNMCKNFSLLPPGGRHSNEIPGDLWRDFFSLNNFDTEWSHSRSAWE